jgi:predicted Zn-dependent protease
MRTTSILLLLGLAPVLLVSCASTPYTGRQRLLLTEEEQETQLGAELYQEELAKVRAVHGPAAERIRHIGGRVAREAEQPDWQWEFNLLDSPEPNAFCLPGGKVAVFTGLLDVARTDGQLAAVIGHEVAHAVLRHGGERVSQSMVADGLVTVAAILTSTDPATRETAAAAYGLIGTGVQLRYSRKHELEADQVGLRFMALAGYDPHEALDLWRNMQALGGSKLPAWLSTHPPSEQRLQEIEAYLPQVLPLYERSRRQ